MSAPYELVTVPASPNGAAVCRKFQFPGKLLYCKAANFPFSVRFDAGVTFAFDAGFKRKNDTAFETVTFYNTAPFDLNLQIYVGLGDIDYVGSSDQKVAATFERGNNGTSIVSTALTAKVTAGGNYKFDGTTAAVDFSVNAPTVIPGIYQGHRRKQITFQVVSSGAELYVFDVNGGICKFIDNNQVPQAWESSSDYYCLGNQGGSKFIYSEIFYAN